MIAMENGSPLSKISQPYTTRISLLEANSKLIKKLEDRLHVKKFKPQQGDYIKIGYMRILIQALQVQNGILKDTEINDIKTDLEELKKLLIANGEQRERY